WRDSKSKHGTRRQSWLQPFHYFQLPSYSITMDTITTIAGSLPQLKITHTDTVTLPSTAIPVRRIETETDTDTISISATSTNPLERSVYEYEYENGRRYHAYRAGKYFLPNDEEEQERLNFAHHSCTLYLEGELHCVP